MFSGVTSSARSPSHTKMMTLRAAGPPGCGAAGPPPSPSTTHDKAIKKMDLLIFMVAIFCQPSILRNLIWPGATRLKSSTTTTGVGLAVDLRERAREDGDRARE